MRGDGSEFRASKNSKKSKLFECCEMSRNAWKRGEMTLEVMFERCFRIFSRDLRVLRGFG